ncbi:hypothetical protein TanjilG_02693 [Lupinus angustifolius]|uniref:START domain-containing protein n=1 Tax=Lupinus angustifolius TaxID=3871 RepID=A0A4P1RBL7_LUPAN|nr:hypothetical protein TanjilG_02693 [Lupinus angustifolius]
MVDNKGMNSSNRNILSRNNMPLHDEQVSNYEAQSTMIHDMYGEDGMDLPTSPKDEKTMILELAFEAMEELTMLALARSPLWLPQNNRYGPEILNEDEYYKTFPRGIGPKLFGYKSESSRGYAIILMNHINLIEVLMNVKQWSNMFCGIVSRASTIEVLTPGVNGNYNGALQVISAEFQAPSPFVPTRQAYFARYCKEHTDGSRVVVDVSLDHIRPNAISTCRRRPSGCLIQKSQNGYPMVTWIEHVEVDYGMLHNLYKHVVSSGLTFGATQWLISLERKCRSLSNMMVTTIPTADSGDVWSALSPHYDGVRVMSATNINDPGRPIGLILNVSTSFLLPVSPIKIFNFLREAKFRSQWDVLCRTGQVQENAHISNGGEQGNCITLIQVNQSQNANHNMFILQESCSDCTGSYVVYAPIGINPMHKILSGGEQDCIGLLPSGFAILPFVPNLSSSPLGGYMLDDGSEGSLITVAFQILVDNNPTSKLSPDSVTNVERFLKFSVQKIKNAVMSDVNTHFLHLPIVSAKVNGFICIEASKVLPVVSSEAYYPNQDQPTTP